jgi:glycine/D-amino acid oxidase-like deaminating enzyme
MTAMRPVVTATACAALGDPPWDRPPIPPSGDLPARCDVLVVGAGITGLSAAMWIAGHGRDVIVVDRDFGSGATSRSGGIVLGDTLVGPAPGFLGCDRTLREWIIDRGADCDLFWSGCLELARDESLPPDPVDWRDAGAVRLAGRVSGGVVDPAKLQRAVAAAAVGTGAAFVDRVDVIAIEPDGSGVAVLTDRGRVRAQEVVMAVDAFARTTEFDPWSERVITVALQTVPLSDASLAALGVGLHQAFYTRDLPLLWGRVMPDRSLMIGRETLAIPAEGLSGPANDVAIAGGRLAARVQNLHAALAGVEIRRVWGGPIARSVSGVPAILPDPRLARVVWTGGYGGHGLAQAFTLGRCVAERLT